MARHLPFFNTEPFIGCLIPGITLGMEAEKARGEDIPEAVSYTHLKIQIFSVINKENKVTQAQK